ncbi:GTPase-activating protein [Smittium mucronatum]|uniref:GTPase-activating protein n=1 Tax=Smittium mucronatum TaxID=133383 RepID=A0A1R0GWG3_9FUNG|nr:GTPase-activating protein [Smittium mucronatum]
MHSFWKNSLDYLWGDSDSASYHLGDLNAVLYGQLLYLAQEFPSFLGYSFHSKLSKAALPLVSESITSLFQNNTPKFIQLISFIIKIDVQNSTDISMFLRDNNLHSNLIRFYLQSPECIKYLQVIVIPTFESISNGCRPSPQQTSKRFSVPFKKSSIIIPSFSQFSPKLITASAFGSENPSSNNSASTSKTKAINPSKSSDFKPSIDLKSGYGSPSSQEFSNVNILTAELLDRIIIDFDIVPLGVKIISNSIKTNVQKFFPDKSVSIINSLIGGFFFLRFINPSIMIPERIFDFNDPIDSSTRRELTNVAKNIQYLANHPISLPPSSSSNNNSSLSSDISPSQISNLLKIDRILENLSLSSPESFNVSKTIESPSSTVHSSNFKNNESSGTFKKDETVKLSSHFEKEDSDIHIIKSDIVSDDQKSKGHIPKKDSSSHLHGNQFEIPTPESSEDSNFVEISLKSLYLIHELILETMPYWESDSEHVLIMETCLSKLRLPPLQFEVENNPTFKIKLLNPYLVH